MALLPFCIASVYISIPPFRLHGGRLFQEGEPEGADGGEGGAIMP